MPSDLQSARFDYLHKLPFSHSKNLEEARIELAALAYETSELPLLYSKIKQGASPSICKAII